MNLLKKWYIQKVDFTGTPYNSSRSHCGKSSGGSCRHLQSARFKKPGVLFAINSKITYIKYVHSFSNYIFEWLLFNLGALGCSFKLSLGLKDTLRTFIFFNIFFLAHILGLLGLIEEYCIKLIGLFIN